MNKDHGYTLAELADETGLTERTVRYYIERVLPPHHKQGRGKLARYGQDTLNCIRFIVLVGERYGFKPGQAKGVLADVPQETIDRVVRGEEELAVMTVPSAPARVKHGTGPQSALRQRSGWRSTWLLRNQVVRPTDYRGPPRIQCLRQKCPDRLPDLTLTNLFLIPWRNQQKPWRTIFADEQLRIQCRGNRKLTSHQEEQIEAAARLIELALRL